MSIRAIQSLTDIRDIGAKLVFSSKNPKDIIIKPIESGNKKLLSSLEQMAATNISAVQKPGKHKIPRFLYHFTDENSLRTIMQEGKIRPSCPNLDVNGVYMVDMNNFLKYWKVDGCWSLALNEETSILSELINRAQHDKGNISCIKIPTCGLDLDLLKIRSQNRLSFAVEAGTPVDSIVDSVKKLPLYNQKKEAIEYIYDMEIPIDGCKIMRPTKASEIHCPSDGIAQHKEGLKILQELFKGEPEQIGITAQLNDII